MKGKITVSGNIKIENISYDFFQAIKNEMIIPNPLYSTLERLGKRTYNVPKTYQMYTKIGDNVFIPFGSVSFFKEYIKQCSYIGIQRPEKKITLSIKVPPLDYQKKAVDFVISKHFHRGVIVGSTGSGKTNIGLYIIKKLGLRALWVTHTRDLLKQSRERAYDIFGKNLSAGEITAGKINIGKDITFATIQTLSKVVDSVKNEFDVIIVDEAHHCVGSPTLTTMFYKTMNKMVAFYKFGLTATPHRADGLDKMIFAILGNIVYEIPASDVKSRVLPINYSIISNKKYYDFWQYTDSAGRLDYIALTKLLAFDNDRNQLLIDLVKKIYSSSGGILILCKLVKHCEILYNLLLKENFKVDIIVGKTTHRESILKSKETKIIVATNSLAKEGLDLVRYSDLIIAYTLKQKNEFIQTAGRVRRVDGIKKIANIYEVCDESINFIKKRCFTHSNWAKKML